MGIMVFVRRARKWRIYVLSNLNLIESISLECGCKWTDVGTKIKDIIEFDGRFVD
jgi:hypothetical protein